MRSFPDEYSVMVQGASRGIGLEFARQLAEREGIARLIATCRQPDRAQALAALAGGHDRIRVIELDVTREPSIERAARAVGEHTERLHLLINCAGVLHDPGRGLRPEKRLADVDPDQLAHSFAVNAIGPLLVAKHFERFFAHDEHAVFASLSARVGSIGDNRLGGWYGYRASKAAQNMFTRTLGVEFARKRRGTICVALHPGTTDTDLSKPFQGNVPEDKLFSTQRAVRQLLEVIDGLDSGDNGRFIAWDGQAIPW